MLDLGDAADVSVVTLNKYTRLKYELLLRLTAAAFMSILLSFTSPG